MSTNGHHLPIMRSLYAATLRKECAIKQKSGRYGRTLQARCWQIVSSSASDVRDGMLPPCPCSEQQHTSHLQNRGQYLFIFSPGATSHWNSTGNYFFPTFLHLKPVCPPHMTGVKCGCQAQDRHRPLSADWRWHLQSKPCTVSVVVHFTSLCQ